MSARSLLTACAMLVIAALPAAAQEWRGWNIHAAGRDYLITLKRWILSPGRRFNSAKPARPLWLI